MKVKFVRSYRSKKGNVTFVYSVHGKDAELAAYKTASGEFYRTDDATGVPLWFTTRFIGDNGTLILTSNGNIVPDMSEFDKAASLVKQYGGDFGQSLAQAATANLLNSKPVTSTVSAPVIPADEPVIPEDVPALPE